MALNPKAQEAVEHAGLSQYQRSLLSHPKGVTKRLLTQVLSKLEIVGSYDSHIGERVDDFLNGIYDGTIVADNKPLFNSEVISALDNANLTDYQRNLCYRDLVTDSLINNVLTKLGYGGDYKAYVNTPTVDFLNKIIDGSKKITKTMPSSSSNNVNLQHALDCALRLESCKNSNQKSGYIIGGKKYENYMDKDSWVSFLEEMELKYNDAYIAYTKGGGSELKEKKYPPKMASFGSSSRFIYLLGRDINGFMFEKKFKTSIRSGSSNLDGFIEQANQSICIEAKCRELYGRTHIGEKRSIAYKQLLEFISKNHGTLSFHTALSKPDRISIISKIGDKVISHFDILQLICHFCGIANQILKGRIAPNIKFMYLIYNPQYLDESLFEQDEKSGILKIYEETVKEMSSIDMNILFGVIIKYLSPNTNINYSFEFKTADQETFKNCILS